SDIEDAGVKSALQYSLQYGPGATKYPVDYIQGVISRLDNNELNKVSKIYNFSLGLKNTLTGNGFGQMMAGNQVQVIKNTMSFVSNILGTDQPKIQRLFSGDPTAANEIPFDKLLDGVSGLMTTADQMKNIFSASASTNFADRMMQGINLLPTMLGYYQSFAGDPNDPSNQEFSKMVNLTNQYWRDGQQLVSVIGNMKNMFGNNGFNVVDAYTYYGNLANTLKENSILKLADGIKLEFGLNDSQFGEKLPDWMRNARWANLLSAPNNKTVSQWVNTINNTFPQMSETLLNTDEKKDLYNFGTQMMIQGANQNTMMPIMDYYLRKGNKDIPLGFTQSMLSGNTQSMMNATGQFMQNWANDPKNNVSPEIASAISPVMNAISTNDWSNIDDAARNQFKNWLNKTENWQKFFGTNNDYLKGTVTDLLASGNFNNFGQIVGNNWQDIARGVFGQKFDSFLGQVGLTQQLGNQFWQNPFKSIMGPNPFSLGANSSDLSKYFGNVAEGAFNSIFTAVTTMLMSSLDPAFAGLEESLGLQAGTISGVLGALMPALFIPGFNIGLALIGYFMPQILSGLGLGSVGKIFGSSGTADKPRVEVWCAMDYYPVLEVGKDEAAPNYDIAFGSDPPATPYKESQITIDNEGLNKEKDLIGDGSGGPWSKYDGGRAQSGEFRIDNDKKKNDNGKVLTQKIPLAAKFKIKQLVGELLRINDENKTANNQLLPRQIKTYKDDSFSPQFLYVLNLKYGEVSTDDAGETIVNITMKKKIDDYGVRRGVFSEKYHIDNVHWGY
ncbi:MAG: hypothetical protein M1338_03925, partial [Patescibacteria group bacterium]|nr:hypothetical protein [Patescibacteria group bacterium]